MFPALLSRPLTCVVVLAATLATCALSAAPAPAATGRVALDVGLPAPANNVDSAGANSAVALPDGGAVLFGNDPGKGIVAAALRPNLSLDTSFGQGGVAHVPVAGGQFLFQSALRQADGRLVLVGTTPSRSNVFELRQLALVRLSPNGALDTSFGSGGVAQPGIQGSCGGSCEPAALGPDGTIVVTGNTGANSPAIATNPNAPNDFGWVVARLTASGSLDPTFGQNGVENVPGSTPGTSFGYGVAIDSEGGITLLGAQGTTGQNTTPRVARLLDDGSPDPSFNDGSPAQVPIAIAFHFVVGPDGSSTVLGFQAVARLTPGGAVDSSFGNQGTVPLASGGFSRILAAPGGGVMVYRPDTPQPRPASRASIVADRIDATGQVTEAAISLPYGGGTASFLGARHRILPVPHLSQNGFVVGPIVTRPNGGFLAAGGISTVQPSGEGAGFSGAQFAATALTPALTLDRAIGLATNHATVSLHVARQRARTAFNRRAVNVLVTSSGAGLTLIRVRDRHHHTLAVGLEPVYKRGTTRVRVPIARSGLRVLRHGRRVGVRATATFRNLLAATKRGSSRAADLR